MTDRLLADQLPDHASKGALAAVDRLLNAGADVHIGNDRALQWAARHGHLAVVERLLVAGANVHANTDGALRWSSSNGYLPVVDCLIAAGADVHANTELALRWASEHRYGPVVERLLDADADLDAALGYLDGQDPETAQWLREAHKQLQAKQVAHVLKGLPSEGADHPSDGEIGL